jgi:hypothetical protein
MLQKQNANPAILFTFWFRIVQDSKSLLMFLLGLCVKMLFMHSAIEFNLYSSPSIIRMIKSRRMRRTGHIARMGETRNAYRILVGKAEGKRPQGRTRRRWVENIRMDLREIGWDGMDWIDLAQDRDQWRALVNTGNAGKFLSSCRIGGSPRRAQLHE